MMHEQQRQDMKARLERERSEHYKRMHLQTITERSNEESAAHDSLLMQSLMPEEQHNRSLASSRAVSEKSRKDKKEKKEKKRGRDRT